MNPYPTEQELLEMSLAHFEMHAHELLGKPLTDDQRAELLGVAADIRQRITNSEAA